VTNTVVEGYRLSPQQARLWALGQAYAELPLGAACALRLRGPLDPAALGEAVARVADRHEILRTTFRAPADGGAPVQVVGAAGEALLEFRDLAGLPERERAALEAAAWAAAVGPHAGAEGAPLRAVLLRRGADDHVLHLSLPALCADAATRELLVAEIGAEYAEGPRGDWEDADEPLQYVDFSEWLHETVESDAAGEGRAFWSRHPLTDEGPLPDAWPVSPSRGAAGFAVEHRLLDAAAARRVERAADAHGVDAEAWLLAAWRAVLRRHLGGEGFAVGVAADGRVFDEMRGGLGPFGRYLPLRGDVEGAASFAAVAGATGGALRQARAWQAFHAWPAANGHGPAHLRFGFDWAERAESGRWGGVEWRVERRWHQAERFGLRLSAERTEDGVRLALWYDAAAVPAEGAARLLRRLAALLASAVDDPAAPVDALALLDAEERAEALGGTGALASFPADEPLHRRFERQAARAPHAVAVSCGDERLTYGELDERANRLARRLRARGVGPEARVGLCLERGIDAVVGILAILKAGGAYVPMDPGYPADRLAYVLEDAGIRVLLASSAIRDRIPPSAAVDVICLDAEWARIAEEDGAPLSGGAGADSLAYVIYTSGSTGRPKGVLVTHAHVARLFAATDASFGFGADDVWTLFHSLAFDFSVWELWGALLYGGRLVVVPFAVSRDPAAFRALLARDGVTVLNQTPSAFRQLIAADADADEPLALRRVVFGGEALDPAALRPWIDRHGAETPRLVNMYGITETTVHVTHRPLTADDAARGGWSPVGVPIPDLSVHLLDGRLNPAAPGLAGEMFVGGAGVARGYLGRPALTAERFVPDPFSAVPGARMYRSGDRARRLPGGELEFLGRADEQVKIRGFRIEPGEIEAALRGHPAVADAAVAAREDAPGEKRLVAYVVPADGVEAAPAELRAHLAASLPEHMIPAAFVSLPRLPLTTNGKLDRRALPAPAAAEDGGEPYVAPRTPTEEVLAAVWAEVLGRERVGIDDSFFAIGGDSILSVRVAALARERGLPLEIADLFAHPTVRALAERVARGGSEAAALQAILGRDRRPFDLVAAEDRARMPEDAEDAYPLAALQAGMLYHLALTADGAPAYHNVDSFQFRGRFDEAAFRTALARAAARQENLRTSIHLAGFSEPLQVVHRQAEIPLRVDDVRHLDDAAQEALLAGIRDREWRTPFDLARAPLLRLHVHLRADDRFHLTLAENHAINDGWSLTSLFAELFEDQAALLRGEPLPERPVPALRFRDFVELERATMASGESRRFWAERLDGFVPGRLPRATGAARDAGGRGTERVEVPLSPEVRAGLAALARSQGVPLKSVLLAAHVKVMGLSTGERDVVTGLTTNGRPEVAGGADVRGLFLNTVPFRLRLGEGSWESLVREVFRAEAEILPHRRYPLAQLQREHGPERLFETAFNLVRFHSLAEVLRSGVVDVVSGHDAGDTDHTLAAAAQLHPVTSEIMLFALTCQAGELTRAQAREIADRYRRVLEAMAADPSARHDRFAALAAAERALVVEGWNRTEADHPTDGVHRRFEARAERSPDAVAVVAGDESLTYGELNARANRLARHLVRLGVGAETRVGICLERGAELIAAMLAVLKAGGAYVPLDPAYPAERLSFVLADSAAAVLVTREALRGAVTAPPGVEVVELDAQADRIAREAADGVEGGAGARSLAYVIYTSGSTGTPKGVAVEHGALGNVCAWHARALGITGADRASQLISAGFDGSVLEIWATLASGGCVQVVPDAVRADPPELRDWLVRRGTTISTTPASLAEPLLALEWPRRAALRWLLSGADRLRSRPAADAPFALLNNYGPTETTSIVTSVVVEAEGEGAPSIGGPGDNNRVYVLDAGMQPVPAGVPGELYVGGAQVARGYLGRPALTAERFVPDAFGAPGGRLYRTGDRVRWREGLEFLCRIDAQVKIRGFRIEPGEVEAVLRRHAGVRDCAVVAREHGPGDLRLVAYVVGAEETDVDALRPYLRERLPEYMVPAAFVAMDALPLTPNGKLDARALPAPALASAREFVAPRTPLEASVAEIWAEVLEVERVGAHDGFFDLGGHSLLIMRIVARVRAEFGVELSIRALFAASTVEGMAAEIERLVYEEIAALPEPEAEAETATLAGAHL
jgi:amino acid adenylation domain-containing protein